MTDSAIIRELQQVVRSLSPWITTDEMTAGLSWFTFHDSRHNAATRIGRQVGRHGKLSEFEFCAMFGWKNPKYAMVYFNPSAADIADRL